METKISIINRDPVAVTSFLRRLGRKKFDERITFRKSFRPKFSQLYLELEGETCWLMMEGEYRPNVLFSLDLDEIPLFGWQVSGKVKKRTKK